MKKNTTPSRNKAPQQMRFSRFFFRRLLVLTLVCTIFDAAFLQTKYMQETEQSCSEIWHDQCEYFFTPFYGDQSEADRIAEKDSIPVLLQRISQASVEVESEIDLYTDVSVMLMDTATGEYTVSQPSVILRSKNIIGTDEEIERYTEPEESEEIAEELLRNYRKNYAMKQIYEAANDDKLLEHSDLIRNFLYSYSRFDYMPLHAYVHGDSFRGLEYGVFVNGKLRSVYHRETSAPAEWSSLLRDMYIPQGDSYVYDNSLDTDLEYRQTHEEYLTGMYLLGRPANTRSGNAMQQVAALVDSEMPALLQSYRSSAESQDDNSQTQEIEYHIMEQDALENGWPLQKLRPDQQFKLIWSLPGICCGKLKDSPFSKATDKRFTYANDLNDDIYIQIIPQGSYTEKLVQYYANAREVQINGKGYSLFVCMSREPLKKCIPLTVAFGIQLLSIAILLSLLWALVSYLRARRRYEMDEYRRSLTAALAHDLKSPLTAISGYAENLSSGVHPEKQAHYSDSILEGTQYMDNIITNVLDLARLEQNTKAKKQKIELIALLKEINANRQDEIESRKLNVEITGSCTVRADPLMMMQALRNLLDNAVKFTPDGGSITVTGEGSTLRISNDIAEEKAANVEQLCEAFVKGDSARSNRKGTGLGLSVVRQIAELNRLHFSLESSGHRFNVILRGKKGLRTRKE